MAASNSRHRSQEALPIREVAPRRCAAQAATSHSAAYGGRAQDHGGNGATETGTKKGTLFELFGGLEGGILFELFGGLEGGTNGTYYGLD